MPIDKQKQQPRVGAVITFPPGTTKEQADRMLLTFAMGRGITYSGPHEYDAAWGGPVWYIP